MTASSTASTVAETFAEAYARRPSGVWHAPGRINLIGEHTDYNDGLVLPFAIAQGVSVAASRRDDDLLELRSLQAIESPAFVSLSALEPGSVSGWAAYPAGVLWALRNAGHPVGGISLLYDSDLPQGAGLSSSAALECATALAVNDLFGLGLPGLELARAAQRAENGFVGMPCGILDQSASMLCKEDHALLLDCRSGLSSQIPLALGAFTVLVIDTRAVHSLVDGEYASRRAACEEAARLLGVPALRDVKDLAGALAALPDPVLRRRVQHVVTENHRVEAVVGLLRAGAVAEVGALLTASHLSLRDQFEVSWPEADVAVATALAAGARGGRMVGGGFGGSVITLVPLDRVPQVREAVTSAFLSRGWAAPAYLTALPAPGARRLG
ncbi:MAG: galactokinase [Actinomycetia bacterium]|nr:galactokinase [Actinomycetes bacterium]